ncbi:hypothetical protein AAC387_Pa10g0686 [Persea americana]
MPSLINYGGVIIAANLMGCDVQDWMLALSTCSILAGNDNTVQKLTSQQAIDTRDALAKLQQHFNRHLFKLERECFSTGF